MSHQALDTLLRDRLYGSRVQAFWGEWLSNSGHFFILKSLATITIWGWGEFLNDPADYALAISFFVQAWFLSRPQANRWLGNLIGPATYSLVDIPLDGGEFFYDPSHWVLWGSALTIATLQGGRQRWSWGWWVLPLESVARSLMVALFYAVTSAAELQEQDFLRFLFYSWHQGSHTFLLWALILLSLVLGVQQGQVDRRQHQVRSTAATLSNLATWGLGSHAVVRAISDPGAQAFQRVERTIVFMDIRGFTAWCENHSPDEVATLLNRYYQAVEPVAAAWQPLRIALTADEIMAIFERVDQGVQAAEAMQNAARSMLLNDRLGAGCAVHCGAVVEGWFGSDSVRTYTAIGDAVNTAKRLEGLTPAGEITISDRVQISLPPDVWGDRLTRLPPFTVKGKTEPLKAWRLESGLGRLSEIVDR